MVYDEVVAVCARKRRYGRLHTSLKTISIAALSVCVKNSVLVDAIFDQYPADLTIVPKNVVYPLQRLPYLGSLCKLQPGCLSLPGRCHIEDNAFGFCYVV